MAKASGFFNGGYISTIAQEKEVFGGISALLTSIGLVKTADTGQLDIPAISVLVTSGTYAGYEIRSWTDSVGTVFMKWEYGMNSAISRIRITIGTGSDGAGNITGAIASLTNITFQVGFVTTYLQSYNIANRSGDSWSIYIPTNVGPMIFAFDRQRDPSTGASIANSYYTFRTNSTAGITICTRPLEAFSVTDTAYTHTFAIDYVAGSGMSGLGLEPVAMEAMPVFGAWPHAAVQPVLMQYWATEHMTPYGIFKANVYGQVRTYITISLGSSNYLITYKATPKAGLAMLWED